MTSRSEIQIAIVTGASTGLGLALAAQLIDRGITVFAVSKTKRHWAKAREVVTNAKKFILEQVDVTSETKIKKYIASVVKRCAKIDLLVNNAGYGGLLARVEDHTLPEFQKHLSANLLSAFLMCKHTLPIFRKQKRGMILNISSMAGKRAVPRLSAYSASKFGLIALTQAIAKENDDIDLKSLAICPGGMNTEMRRNLFGEADAARQQTPEFVAGVIMQVIDGKVSMLSGSDISIRHGKITSIYVPPSS